MVVRRLIKGRGQMIMEVRTRRLESTRRPGLNTSRCSGPRLTGVIFLSPKSHNILATTFFRF